MIKINTDTNLLNELLEYHSNYIQKTISKNWYEMETNNVKIDNKTIDKNELAHINYAINCKLGSNAASPNLLLKNIVQICTTQNLNVYAILSDDLFSDVPKSLKKRYVKILLRIIGYEKFNKGVSLESNKIIWNRHMLLDKLNIKVCPYCNRQYISSLYKNNKKTATADIDHYYPKSQYPLLSMNFFNLIPSCSICNSRLKGRQKLTKEDITLNPYFDDSDSLVFKISDNKIEELYNYAKPNIIVAVNGEKDELTQKRAKNSKKIFYLSEIYEVHAKEAENIRENINRFSKEYFEHTFKKNYNGLFEDYEELKRVLFPFNSLDNGDEPLVKLKKDIYNQLNF